MNRILGENFRTVACFKRSAFIGLFSSDSDKPIGLKLKLLHMTSPQLTREFRQLQQHETPKSTSQPVCRETTSTDS